MSKVTVIGFTNSGKTTYLVGMYMAMASVVKNFSMIAKDDKLDLQLNDLWDKMTQGQAPPPSDRLESYEFHLAHNFKPVCDFEWLDYPGGLLSGIGENNDIARFRSDLAVSDCVLFIIDGSLLAVNSAKDANDYATKLQTKLGFNQSISRELSALAKLSSDGVVLPPIALVITKCDLISAEYQDALNTVLHNRFSAIFDAADRIVLQTAVSMGGPIEVENFVPQPFCVEQPIAFAVLTIFIKLIEAARERIKENVNFLNETSNKFFAETRYGSEMSRAKSNLKELQDAIKKYSAHCLNLIDVFSENKKIYVGGAEKNLRNYYRNTLVNLTDTDSLISSVKHLL